MLPIEKNSYWVFTDIFHLILQVFAFLFIYRKEKRKTNEHFQERAFSREDLGQR